MHNFLISIKKRWVLITAIVLLCFSLFFAYTIFISMGYFNFNQQTIVGTIYIENVDESQYPSYISSEINDWRNKSTYKINYQEFSLEIDLSYFTLDIDDTIQSINEGQVNKVKFEISNESKTELLTQLNDTFSSNILATFDFDTFLSTVNDHIEVMNIFKSYNLENYLDDDVSETIIDSVTISNIETTDVAAIIALITQIEVNPESRFSLLEELVDYTLTNNQLSILASGIQNITQNTPFNGYIFEQSSDMPSWVQEGLNVRVLKTNNYDFSFFNPSDFSYLINVTSSSNDTLTLELVGYPFSTQYSVDKITETILVYDTVYYENELLGAATPNIIITDTVEDTIYHLLEQTGIDGKILVYTRTSTLPDGTTIENDLYRETYDQVPEIYQENIVPKGGE